MFSVIGYEIRMNSLTHSMDQSLSQETNSHLSGQKIPCLLWNTKVHRSLPLVPVLSKMHPVHTL